MGHDWDPCCRISRARSTGEAYHTVDYRSGAELAGKKVLVVGAGNSGCDIACDAAMHASQAWISMRRGYHFLPKHFFGQPTDEFFRAGPHIPNWLAPSLLAVLLRDHRGRPAPLRPAEAGPQAARDASDHQLAAPAPPRTRRRRLRSRTSRSCAGSSVRFADGSEIEPDVILWATGYRPTIPCLDAGGIHLAESGEDLYLNMFSREHPGLYVMGFFGTAGAAYPIVSKQGALLAAVLARAGEEWRRDARVRAAAREAARAHGRHALHRAHRDTRSTCSSRSI